MTYRAVRTVRSVLEASHQDLDSIDLHSSARLAAAGYMTVALLKVAKFEDLNGHYPPGLSIPVARLLSDKNNQGDFYDFPSPLRCSTGIPALTHIPRGLDCPNTPLLTGNLQSYKLHDPTCAWPWSICSAVIQWDAAFLCVSLLQCIVEHDRHVRLYSQYLKVAKLIKIGSNLSNG